MTWHGFLGQLCLPMLLGFVWMPSHDAIALTRIFDNEAGDDDWFNSVNWQPDGDPVDTDDLIVGGGATATTSQNVITSNGGSITISDSGTDVTFANLSIGLFGVGDLLIQSGAHVNGFFTAAGTAAESNGTINVSGNGTVWDAGQLITIGGSGTGLMDVSGGAQVTSIAGVVGDNPDSNATVSLQGAGSSWTMTQRLEVGNQGAALLTIDGATVSNAQGTLGVSGPMSSGEVFVSGGGLWQVGGTLAVGGEGAGVLRIGPGGSVTSLFANVAASPGSTGEVIIDGAGATWENTVVTDLYVGGSSTSTGGEASVTLANGGMLTTAGGLRIRSAGLVMLDGGTLQVGLPPITVDGELTGAGTVNGNVMNAGIVRPGVPTGLLTINGDYQQSQTGSLEIELSTTQTDLLDVNGAATLSGKLEVRLIGGIVPSGGDDFVVLAADTLGGGFLNLSSGQRLYVNEPEGGSFQVNYGVSTPQGAKSVVLDNYLEGLPGDYVNDGKVDGADFLAWQRGESVAPGTSIDLLIWEINFGATDGLLLASATAVPEPATWIALLFGMMALHFQRIRTPFLSDWLAGKVGECPAHVRDRDGGA